MNSEYAILPCVNIFLYCEIRLKHLQVEDYNNFMIIFARENLSTSPRPQHYQCWEILQNYIKKRLNLHIHDANFSAGDVHQPYLRELKGESQQTKGPEQHEPWPHVSLKSRDHQQIPGKHGPCLHLEIKFKASEKSIDYKLDKISEQCLIVTRNT